MIKGIKIIKKTCEKKTLKYIGVLNQILSFVYHYEDYMIDQFTKDMLQELVVGLETGHLEIIEYGNYVAEEVGENNAI